jgi:hypothetical protein
MNGGGVDSSCETGVGCDKIESEDDVAYLRVK